MPFCSLILCKKGCTRVDPKSDPRVLIWTNLEEVHKMMLHSKYESCLPSGFREEDFWRFSHFHPSCSDELKGMRPGGAQIWPKGLDMNKLGRGPQDDATYQIWKLLSIWFWRRWFLKILLYKRIKVAKVTHFQIFFFKSYYIVLSNFVLHHWL